MFMNYLNLKFGEGLSQNKVKVLQSEIKNFLDYIWKNKEKELWILNPSMVTSAWYNWGYVPTQVELYLVAKHWPLPALNKHYPKGLLRLGARIKGLPL